MESTVLMSMSEFKMHTMRAYIAGIVDGEGCFQFYIREKANPVDGEKSKIRTDYALSITNTDLPMLEKIRDFLRVGSIRLSVKKPTMSVYRYEIRRKNDIKAVIDILKPYLQVKKQQAILMKICLDNVEDHGLCRALAVIMSKMKRGFNYETE